MTEKFLRGKQPLTMYRGSGGGIGGYLYRGGVLEADRVHAEDAERLVGEGFLEWVVKDGEQFKLAEDTETGKAGDPVTVGDNGLVPEDENNDIGRLNEQAPAKPDDDVEAKRAAARAKLPTDGGEPDGRAGQAVWVEYMVARGGNYADLKDVTKADLQKLADQQK